MRESDWWQHDMLKQEHEAIEALNAVAAAGLTAEADTLALASGLWGRWKGDKPKHQAGIWP